METSCRGLTPLPAYFVPAFLERDVNVDGQSSPRPRRVRLQLIVRTNAESVTSSKSCCVEKLGVYHRNDVIVGQSCPALSSEAALRGPFALSTQEQASADFEVQAEAA